MYKGLKEQVNTNKIVAKSTVKSRVKKQVKSKYSFKSIKNSTVWSQVVYSEYNPSLKIKLRTSKLQVNSHYKSAKTSANTKECHVK